MLSRRSLFGGLAGLFAAPSIVRAANLMPVNAPKEALYEWKQIAVPISIDELVSECDFADMVTKTLAVREAEFAANIKRNNALLRRLIAREVIVSG